MKQLYSIDKYGNENLIGNYELYPQNYNGEYRIYNLTSKKYGLINTKGEILIPCEYDQIDTSKYFDTIKVKKDGKYGYFDSKGNIIIKCSYGMALEFCEEITAVKDNYDDERFYLITKEGNKISNTNVDYLFQSSKNKLIPFKLEDKYGLINNLGEIIVENIYDNAWSLDEEFASVKKGEKWAR